ncbi:MAG: hypothetical protein NZM37_00800 [Sandaracinaceae bacterium]|nr:hypothetical protein [Sandaracinaceae bacterium]
MLKTGWQSWVCLVIACGCSRGEGKGVSVQAEVQAFAHQLDRDPAWPFLQDVDQAIEEERPVLASQILENGAIPATKRWADEIAAMRFETLEARRLRERFLRLLKLRHRTLEAMRRALEEGLGMEEGEAKWVEALHEHTRVELEIASFYREIDKMLGRKSKRELPKRVFQPLNVPQNAEGKAGPDPEDFGESEEILSHPEASEPIVIHDPE